MTKYEFEIDFKVGDNVAFIESISKGIFEGQITAIQFCVTESGVSVWLSVGKHLVLARDCYSSKEEIIELLTRDRDV